MKKIKLLAPILTISGLGAVVAPLVTLTSCGNKEQEVDRHVELDKESSDFANIEITKATSFGVDCKVTSKDPEQVEIESVEITINATKLTNGEFNFDRNTGEIHIPKTTLDNHKDGDITITTNLKVKPTAKMIEIGDIQGSEGSEYCLVKATALGLKYDGDITIPQKLSDGNTEYPVKGIADEGFKNSNVNKIIFAKSDNITYIGNDAFAGSKIVSFTVPKNALYLGVNVFNNSELKQILFEEGNTQLTLLCSSSFSNTKITQITIPTCVTKIDYDVFNGCQSLVSVFFENQNNWSQIIEGKQGLSIAVTDSDKNAKNLKDCTGSEATGTNWGRTGIVRS